ncbi:protein O-GlcNAcase [Hydra vulgaris]|nr:protein O-GlcNAcase-like isoform X1 [Hydra vulgaris]
MNFICGVIEGFYGSPWVFNERLDLFQRMKVLGLNTYLYGPKDDIKHRREWRVKYTDVEKAMLLRLIQESKANSVEFVYSISPGLDIVFSSDVDVQLLQEKLTQVQLLGCSSFAILFDDIEPELCLTDKSEFRSFGEAQMVLINKIYNFLGEVKIMMMCPTEYCDSRAKPNIETSEYLKTLGDGLHKDIHILWTGEKVVSHTITDQSVKTLTSVLKRKPVIWDNIHANDYDQRRLFLGPYKGRSSKLYQSVSGILTNPNCEYECNFIAFHSLSGWIKYCVSKSKDEIQEVCEYDSKLALEEGIKKWMELFNLKRDIFYGEKFSNKMLLNEINSFVSSEENGESKNNPENESDSSPHKKIKPSLIGFSDVFLLCHLFYLPYEHGDSGQKMLDDFRWLKENAVDVHAIDQYKVHEWNQRAHFFQENCNAVADMFAKFNNIPNRRILQQLYPYIYDLKETVNNLSSFVKWLGSEKRKNSGKLFPENPEAWFFRGGITEEMQRLVPNPKEEKLESRYIVQTIRPYLQHDKVGLYKLCLHQCDFPNAFVTYPDLPGDSELGAFLEFSPENVYVIEIDDVICGYGALCEDARLFYKNISNKWLPSIHERYKTQNNPITWSIEDEAINRLFHPQDVSPTLLNNYPALLTIKMSNKDMNVARRLLKCVCSRLKHNVNVFCRLSESLNRQYETFYRELGFSSIQYDDLPVNEIFYGWKKN